MPTHCCLRRSLQTWRSLDDLQVVCTLGPKSRSVEVLSELLKAGMSVARFNFSHGSHDYHQVCSSVTVGKTSADQVTEYDLPGQSTLVESSLHSPELQSDTESQAKLSPKTARILQETLETLRTAMSQTQIMCAVMLDTKVYHEALSMPQLRQMTKKPNRHLVWSTRFCVDFVDGVHEILLLLLPLSTSPCILTRACIQISYMRMQGPEIRTGFLQDPDKPVKLVSGKEVTLTTDYDAKGTDDLIACRCVTTVLLSCNGAKPLKVPGVWGLQCCASLACICQPHVIM